MLQRSIGMKESIWGLIVRCSCCNRIAVLTGGVFFFFLFGVQPAGTGDALMAKSTAEVGAMNRDGMGT